MDSWRGPHNSKPKFNDIDQLDHDIEELLRQRRGGGGGETKQPTWNNNVRIPMSSLMGDLYGFEDEEEENSVKVERKEVQDDNGDDEGEDDDDEGIDWLSTAAVRPDKKISTSIGANEQPIRFTFGKGLIDDDDN